MGKEEKGLMIVDGMRESHCGTEFQAMPIRRRVSPDEDDGTWFVLYSLHRRFIRGGRTRFAPRWRFAAGGVGKVMK